MCSMIVDKVMFSQFRFLARVIVARLVKKWVKKRVFLSMLNDKVDSVTKEIWFVVTLCTPWRSLCKEEDNTLEEEEKHRVSFHAKPFNPIFLITSQFAELIYCLDTA